MKQRETRHDDGDVDDKGENREKTEEAVSRDHERRDGGEPHDGCRFSRLDRISAEARADRTFLDDRKGSRKRARSQEKRQPVHLFLAEIACNLPTAARDFRPDYGCGDHLVIENDREGLADVFPRHPRERGCAFAVELEIDGPLSDAARPVVVSGIGIDEIVAADNHLLMKEDLAARMLGIRQDHVIRRDAIGLGILRGHGPIDKLEGQFRRCADPRLDLIRRQARHLDQDAVLAVRSALSLDGGLCRARRVDTAPDNLDRSRDRVLDAVLQPGWCRLDGDNAVFAALNREVQACAVARARKKRCREWLSQGLEPCQRGLQFIRVSHGDANRIASNHNAGMRDLLLAQRPP